MQGLRSRSAPPVAFTDNHGPPRLIRLLMVINGTILLAPNGIRGVRARRTHWSILLLCIVSVLTLQDRILWWLAPAGSRLCSCRDHGVNRSYSSYIGVAATECVTSLTNQYGSG